jgi:hypothetical protein
MIKIYNMVKARVRNNIIIGLSRDNIELLLKDKPIQFNLKVLGFPEDYTVFVIAGETESAIMDSLKPLIDEATVVKDLRP